PRLASPQALDPRLAHLPRQRDKNGQPSTRRLPWLLNSQDRRGDPRGQATDDICRKLPASYFHASSRHRSTLAESARFHGISAPILLSDQPASPVGQR